MKRRRYRLKRETGFFAAGEELGHALQLLGDGAFKLFVWVCLQAEEATGRLAFDRSELARILGRSRRTLGRHLEELVQAGTCELERSTNQHRQSVLRVRPEFWPYARIEGTAEAAAPSLPGERTRTTETREVGRGESGPDRQPRPAAAAEAACLDKVREALVRPSCVQGRFGPADERLASAWYRAGVPLLSVQRAILLGSARKSLSMINRKASQPVVSLRYFAKSLREVQDGEWQQDYWQHLEYHLKKCEEYWERHPEHAPGRARPNLSQAVAGCSTPASSTANERKEAERETR